MSNGEARRHQHSGEPVAAAVDAALPEPVELYLRRALGKTTRRIRTARLKQRGELPVWKATIVEAAYEFSGEDSGRRG